MPATYLAPNDEVRLMQHGTYAGATPEVLTGQVSDSGKTLSVGDHRHSHRLDRDEMKELSRGGSVYRSADNLWYALYTPQRFFDRYEKDKQADPARVRGVPDDVDTVRESVGAATHLPTQGRYAQQGAQGGAQAAADGGAEPNEYGRTLDDFMAANGGVEATGRTLYVAEITGEHPKYGLDREFATDKDADVQALEPADLAVGGVFEVRDDGVDVRHYVAIEGFADGAGDGVAVETVEVENDNDAILAQVESDESAAVTQLRDDIDGALRTMGEGELEAVAAMLGVGDDANADPADEAKVPPAKIPDADGMSLRGLRQAFAAAHERRTGVRPATQTRAALIDAYAVNIKRNMGGD